MTHATIATRVAATLQVIWNSSQYIICNTLHCRCSKGQFLHPFYIHSQQTPHSWLVMGRYGVAVVSSNSDIVLPNMINFPNRKYSAVLIYRGPVSPRISTNKSCSSLNRSNTFVTAMLCVMPYWVAMYLSYLSKYTLSTLPSPSGFPAISLLSGNQLMINLQMINTGMKHGPLIRYMKLWVAHALGMPGTFSQPPTSKKTVSYRSQHASRHVRHARGVKHVGIANPMWWEKRSRHSRRMCNPQFYVSGKRPMARTFCAYIPGPSRGTSTLILLMSTQCVADTCVLAGLVVVTTPITICGNIQQDDITHNMIICNKYISISRYTYIYTYKNIHMCVCVPWNETLIDPNRNFWSYTVYF